MMESKPYTTPITELPNELSKNIDVATSEGIINIIHKCDKQIFQGWNDSNGVYDESVIDKLQHVVKAATSIIQNGDKAAVVLSGCGTSGRLAFMIARSFNLCLRELGLHPCFHYLIAGGDVALFASREAIEDNPQAGENALKELTEGMSSVLYIGITCGLSAPYVAGQLDYCTKHLDKYTPTLLGFNPVYLARNIEVEGWDKTFLQVATQLESLSDEKKGFIINPIIGPEPITGSSRMKSGSATKIILETIFTAAILKSTEQDSNVDLKNILRAYELVQDTTYKTTDNLAQIIDVAAKSLNSGGHLHYVGYDSLGIVGMIDASECPPTFGSTFEDVQAFIAGGFQTLRNREGRIEEFDISLEKYEEEVVPNLSGDDAVIVLCSDDGFTSNVNLADSSIGSKHTMILNFPIHGKMLSLSTASSCEAYMDVVIPWQEVEELLPPRCLALCQPLLVEMSCKWLCNIITTAAHILKGKVFQNFMVDVKVSNNKLYHRAIGIVQSLAGCGKEESQQCLLKAIYNTDSPGAILLGAPVSQHIQHATQKEKIVPIALIMAITKCQVKEAKEQLKDSPIIRTAINNSIEQS